ncbi:helix-turn-helix domain-containing protein [Nocardia thailandica]|uniref:helix-turn-helix domain-containing protein n=1 Tax=Nocardia thailandica TaxID=257275 RepID=UPI00031900D0|nr:helix-turn-helix domain-containing protein [Nocardia thailandica]
MDQRRADQKIRDRHISAAVKRFAVASAAEAASEEARNRQVNELQQAIQQAHKTAAAELAGLRLRQRAALIEMKDQGQTDDEISELLGLPLRQVRQLLALTPPASTATPPGTAQQSETDVGRVDLRRREPRAGG